MRTGEKEESRTVGWYEHRRLRAWVRMSKVEEKKRREEEERRGGEEEQSR